jgi:DNA-binding CsgD family transcriptional regulator
VARLLLQFGAAGQPSAPSPRPLINESRFFRQRRAGSLCAIPADVRVCDTSPPGLAATRPGRRWCSSPCSSKAGSAGFLLKATPPDRLVDGIRTVSAGEALLAPTLTRRLIEEHVRRPPPGGVPSVLSSLTSRELEVFELIVRGLSNSEIAQHFVVVEATVKTHVNRILTKLQLQSRVQAVVLGYESGLVVPGDQSRSVGLGPSNR